MLQRKQRGGGLKQPAGSTDMEITISGSYLTGDLRDSNGKLTVNLLAKDVK